MSATSLRPSDRLPRLDSPSRKNRPSARLRAPEPPQKEGLSLSALVRDQLMEVLWKGSLQGKTYQMGFLKHSPEITKAIKNGQLDPLIQALSSCYRDVYGDSPWNEYLCCSDPNCDQTLSIEDVYGKRPDSYTLDELEKLPSPDRDQIRCPKDGKEMTPFYPPEDHLQKLKTGFSRKIFATLLFEDDAKLLGFCLGWDTTIDECWDGKIIAGEGDPEKPALPYESYFAEVHQFLGKDKTPRSRALNLAEWGLQKAAQQTGTAVPLMRELYARVAEEAINDGDGDIPVLAHTLKNSRAFQITQRFGFHAGQAVPPHGEVRSYLPIGEAIEGIDRFQSTVRGARIRPISFETQETLIPRDTLVMEMLLDEAVGTDDVGNKQVHRYLAEVAQMLGLKPLKTSVTHLSPLYGLSGWLPLEDGSAIHLYAWDYSDESHPPFLSIDISTPGTIQGKSLLRDHARDFFGASSELTEKTLQEDHEQNWYELAPQIHRQRINITGERTAPVLESEVSDYLKQLAPALDMVQLSEPLIIENSAWIHWETSGVVLHWNGTNISVDIYTCKAFDDQDAVNFTRDYFGMAQTRYKSY